MKDVSAKKRILISLLIVVAVFMVIFQYRYTLNHVLYTDCKCEVYSYDASKCPGPQAGLIISDCSPIPDRIICTKCNKYYLEKYSLGTAFIIEIVLIFMLIGAKKDATKSKKQLVVYYILLIATLAIIIGAIYFILELAGVQFAIPII